MNYGVSISSLNAIVRMKSSVSTTTIMVLTGLTAQPMPPKLRKQNVLSNRIRHATQCLSFVMVSMTVRTLVMKVRCTAQVSICWHCTLVTISHGFKPWLKYLFQIIWDAVDGVSISWFVIDVPDSVQFHHDINFCLKSDSIVVSFSSGTGFLRVDILQFWF